MKVKRGFAAIAVLAVALTAFLVAGCTDKGTEPADTHDGTEELEFSLTFDKPELETLDDITFNLAIHDHHGEPAMDFDDVEMQYRMVGSTTWRSISMTPMVDHFEGQHTFSSSGDYELRVMGVPHHGDGHAHDPEELHHMAEHYHVHRAYEDAGGYRVEYESFPGHIHSGQSVALRFWVVDRATDLPVSGLAPDIRCSETGGAVHVLAAIESSSGTYEVDHTVESAGATVMSLLFTGSDSNPAEVNFDISVSAPH